MMKGPKAVLAETIAGALADFFVVDQNAMETSLLNDAGIILRNTKLKAQHVRLTPMIAAQIEGNVQSVAFQWHWGKGAEEKGGSDWVKDVKLTISGLDFLVVISECSDSPLDQEAADQHESEPTPPVEKGEGIGLLGYVQDQVQRIINTLDLAIVDLSVKLQLPSGDSLYFCATGFHLKSLGMLQGEALNQHLECTTLYFSVMHTDGSTYPVLEPISYKAQCTRVSGQRFLSGIDKGLNVVGESTDDGVVIHIGSEQVMFFNELLGLLLSAKPPHALHSDILSEHSTQLFVVDEESSFFHLPLSAISLVLPNQVKISISGLVVKYRMNGSVMKVEGHDGIIVGGFPFLKLDATSLWSLDFIENEFIIHNPIDDENSHDATVAFVHVRHDEVGYIKDGIDEILTILDSIGNGAVSVLANDDIDPVESATSPRPWSAQLRGAIGFLWEGDDETIDAEFFLRDVVAISEPASIVISAVDQLYIPGILRLSNPVIDTILTFDGSVFDIEVGDIVATLEESVYTPPLEKQTSMDELHTCDSNLSTSDSESLSSQPPTPFILPFGIVARLRAITLYKVDGKTCFLTIDGSRLAMGPHRSLLQSLNHDFGGIRMALTVEHLVLDMIRVENSRISAVLHPEDLETIARFSFQAKSILLSAGYTTRDWEYLIDFRSRKGSSKRRKKMKKKPRSEPNKPINLPFAHVEPLKVSVVVSSNLLSVRDSTLHFKAFNGKRSTTSDDLIRFYASRIMSKVPNMIVNTELFGTGVVDTVAGSYGGATGAVAMGHWAVAAGPLGGVLGVAAFDGIRNTIKAGKASRGAEEDDRFELLDIVRGLKFAAVKATRGGAAKRGKSDDQRGDPIDWAVGATTDVAKYTMQNKSRLGSAGAGTIGFMYGMMLGGPLGAVAGTVMAAVVANKAINGVEKLASRSNKKRMLATKEKKAIKAANASNYNQENSDDKEGGEEVEYTLSDLHARQMAEIEALNSFEVCLKDNPIPVRGILLKRRQFCVWDWRAHYFILDDGELQYFPICRRGQLDDTINETTQDAKHVLIVNTEQPRKVLNVSGLAVSVDNGLSNPNEALFVFTITRPCSRETLWVLAAASEETRNQWVTQIQRQIG